MDAVVVVVAVLVLAVAVVVAAALLLAPATSSSTGSSFPMMTVPMREMHEMMLLLLLLLMRHYFIDSPFQVTLLSTSPRQHTHKHTYIYTLFLHNQHETKPNQKSKKDALIVFHSNSQQALSLAVLCDVRASALASSHTIGKTSFAQNERDTQQHRLFRLLSTSNTAQQEEQALFPVIRLPLYFVRKKKHNTILYMCLCLLLHPRLYPSREC